MLYIRSRSKITNLPLKRMFDENQSSWTPHHWLCYPWFKLINISFFLAESLTVCIISAPILTLSVNWEGGQLWKRHNGHLWLAEPNIRNIYNIKSQAKDVIYVSAQGKAFSKGLICNGFHRHNLFDMKWSSADTKWPPLRGKQISEVLWGSVAQCQWWRTLLIFH